MATRRVSLTTTPVQITDIDDGNTYSARCQGANPVRVSAVTGSTQPETSVPSDLFNPGDSFALQGVNGETIWAWTDRGAADIVYDQVQQ